MKKAAKQTEKETPYLQYNGRIHTDHGVYTPSEFMDKIQATDKLRELVKTGDNFTLNEYLAFKKECSGLGGVSSYDNIGHDVSGSYVDVGRYVTGEPECMVDYNQYAETKFLKVDIQPMRPGGTDNEAILRYNGIMMDLIDHLENTGYRCEVRIKYDLCHNDRNESHAITVMFKPYQEPFNMALFAAICLNPLFIHHVANTHETIIPGLYGRGYSVDLCPDFEFHQKPDHITLPSLYFKGRWNYTPDEFDALRIETLLSDCGAGFLLS